MKEIIEFLILAAICFVCNASGAYVGVKAARRDSSTDAILKYALAESELERLVNERDEARHALFRMTAVEDTEGDQDTEDEPDTRASAYWIYDNPPDENDNLQAVCSHCYAGDSHSADMREKVPYCWKCGAKMGPGPVNYDKEAANDGE